MTTWSVNPSTKPRSIAFTGDVAPVLECQLPEVDLSHWSSTQFEAKKTVVRGSRVGLFDGRTWKGIDVECVVFGADRWPYLLGVSKS